MTLPTCTLRTQRKALFVNPFHLLSSLSQQSLLNSDHDTIRLNVVRQNQLLPTMMCKLTHCIMGNCSCSCCRLLTFYKVSKNYFRNTIVLFVCFVALLPKSTAMVIAGRSIHLTTLFPGQA